MKNDKTKQNKLIVLEYGLNKKKIFKTFKEKDDSIFKHKLYNECYSCYMIDEVLK